VLIETLALVAVPVVDIDGTLFVQGGIFLALVFILNPLLFKPWLETQARRAEAIEGAAKKAVVLREQADTMVVDYETRIAKVREQALDVRGVARREEDLAQAKALADARAAAAAEADAARARIADETKTARAQLATRVDELAQTIADKLLARK
jgi:F-type H+-transporting ATPase subunit b